MREYQQRHNLKRLFYSKITIIILAVLCILMLRTIVEMYGKYQRVDELKQNADKESLVLEEKYARAKAREETLNTERGKEEYIRKTYPVVAEGEGVIVVYDASSSPVSSVRKEIGWIDYIKLYLARLFE